MLPVALGGLAAAVFAGFVYLGRERLGAQGAGLALLRTLAFGALILAFFNPGCTRTELGGPPLVLVDGSLSMGAVGASWQAAMDTALVLAGDDGTIRRFGSPYQAADTSQPTMGTSRLGETLRGIVGGGRAAVAVTDGEIDDVSSLPPSLLDGVKVVVLPRDTVPDVGLVDIVIASRVVQGDTIRMTAVIGTWGGVTDSVAQIEVFVGAQRIHVENLLLPPSPGVARRNIALRPGRLAGGTHALRIKITTPGDREPADDERWRVVTVANQPDVVVLIDPADIEGRFLVSELSAVARSGVKGYARIQSNVWVDVSTLARVPATAVRAAARNAVMLVLRGASPPSDARRGQARWYWPAASDPNAELFEGDWYVNAELPSSPLAGRLAGVEWDSLPPLTGVVPVVPDAAEWVAVTGRRGRRGADQPLLVGQDSSGVRRLTTAATGMWRWDLRGGAAREAYRSVIAAGTDWLLRTGAGRGDVTVEASTSVPRGTPVAFRWLTDDVPDSVTTTIAGPDSSVQVTLFFDASGTALHYMEPGTYRWTIGEAGAASGISVVEEYSDEYPPRPILLGSQAGSGGLALVIDHARDTWWLFAIAVLAFVGEWAWRQRRGLP